MGRINALHKKGVLTEDDRDYLAGAFDHITNLVLRQQLRDFVAGNRAGNHVGLDDISKRERDMLIDGFRAIKRFRNHIRMDATGELF